MTTDHEELHWQGTTIGSFTQSFKFLQIELQMDFKHVDFQTMKTLVRNAVFIM